MIEVQKWIEFVIAVLVGLSTAIPLVRALVIYVKRLGAEKKWGKLVQMVLEQMVLVEQKYNDGIDKKAVVMATIQSCALSVGYELDEEGVRNISELIDAICDAAKTINKY